MCACYRLVWGLDAKGQHSRSLLILLLSKGIHGAPHAQMWIFVFDVMWPQVRAALRRRCTLEGGTPFATLVCVAVTQNPRPLIETPRFLESAALQNST